MAIGVGDVVSPAGFIDRLVLFPDETETAFSQRIEGYIADAESRVAPYELDEADADEFTFAWVHYRAFDAADQRRNANPAAASLSDVASYSYQSGQLSYFGQRAAEFRAEAETIITPEIASGWGMAEVTRGS